MPNLHVAGASSDITWEPTIRLARVRYTEGSTLAAGDATLLIDALQEWIGADAQPFGVLADARGLKGTNADYRARVGDYFKQHHEARIALINMGAVIRIVVEMFRIGTGVSLKAFIDERAAREWLRSTGVAA